MFFWVVLFFGDFWRLAHRSRFLKFMTDRKYERTELKKSTKWICTDFAPDKCFNAQIVADCKNEEEKGHPVLIILAHHAEPCSHYPLNKWKNTGTIQLKN